MSKILWKGKEVVQIINGHGPINWHAYGVSIDTRTIKKGDIFFALAGPNFDGHQFINEAIRKGASAVISNAPALKHKNKVIVVNDVLRALISLGKFSRKRNKGKVIAITGSSGKTTVKEILAILLNCYGKTHFSLSSYNNKIGVSLSLARMPEDTDFSIFEIGMNNYDEISFLSKIVKPDIALVNNVGNAHIEFFKSKKEIEKEKLQIIDGINSGGSLILNEKISIIQSIKNYSKKNNISLKKFGLDHKSNYFLRNYKYSPKASLVEATLAENNLSYKIFAPGFHMALNSLAALSICEILNLPVKDASKQISKFTPIEGRGLTYFIYLDNKNLKIIDESFNANPESMISSIKLLDEVDFDEDKRKILILGDMLELGKFSKNFHIEIARFIKNTNISLVFCSGNEMRYLWENLPYDKKGAYTQKPDELIKPIMEKINNNDILLIKGSSGSKIKLVLNYFNEEKFVRSIA